MGKSENYLVTYIELVRAITCIFMHGFQKQYCTVVVLEEEKCHLKFFSGRLKVKSQGSKWSYIELVRAITCTFMHGF